MFLPLAFVLLGAAAMVTARGTFLSRSASARLFALWSIAAFTCLGCGSSSKDSAVSDSGLVEAGSGADAAGGPPWCTLPLPASEYAANLSTVGASLDALVAQFEHQHLTDGGPSVACPAPGSSGEASYDWGNYAWVKLARGTDAKGTALALSALKCMFTYQDLTAGSPTYGVFRFHVDDAPNPTDNPTELALESIGWILADSLLPASSMSSFSTAIRAGLDAIDAHEECPNYTNICLLQQAVRLSIGAAFSSSSDATIASDGLLRTRKAMTELDAWASTAKAGGIREFDSPTYGENDLEALLLAREGAAVLHDSAALARVTGMLQYFWSDFAANTFRSRGTLTPPYSRTYDLAGGQGMLAYALWLEGLSSPPTAAATLTLGAWLSTGATGGYRPPASALCWSAPSTREVVSQWQQNGKMPRNRYAYLTQDFSLGSATATYPVNSNINLDILVGGSLVSGRSTPLLSVLPDWLDAPFTPVVAGDLSKVTHLTLDPAAVQAQGDLLLLARISAANPGYTAVNGGPVALVNLTTNLILPAKVDALLVNGNALDPSVSGTATYPPIAVAQNGGGVLGMAVIEASGLDCAQPSGAVVETGTPHVDVLPLPVPGEDPAVRVALRHLDSPPSDTSTLTSCFARVALLIVGRHCDGPACGASLSSDLHAALASTVSSYDLSTGAWAVTIKAPDGSMLHVARETATAGVVTETTVNGSTPSFVPLSINGTPVQLAP